MFFFIFSYIELLSNRAPTMFRSRSPASLHFTTPDCMRPSFIHILYTISYPMTTSSIFNSTRTKIAKLPCFKKLKVSVPLNTTTLSLELTTDFPHHHTPPPDHHQTLAPRENRDFDVFIRNIFSPLAPNL